MYHNLSIVGVLTKHQEENSFKLYTRNFTFSWLLVLIVYTMIQGTFHLQQICDTQTILLEEKTYIYYFWILY